MNVMKKNITILVILCIIVMGITACSDNISNTSIDFSKIKSYREIPGVSADDIAAIEELKKERDSLVYGMTLSSEGFINELGEVDGFTAFLCEWLTNLFGIKFDLSILSWNELNNKISSGEVDFSTYSRPIEGDEDHFYMTDPISKRQYMIVQLASSRGIDYIIHDRKPRYAFIINAPTEASIAAASLPDSYIPVFVDNYDEAYRALVRGDADALITTRIAEANLVTYENIKTEDFYPITFTPVSMATNDSSLEVIITVINKALRNDAITHLNNLHKEGLNKYKHYQFFISLNNEEKEYLENVSSVPIAVQYFNYPIVFYNNYEKKWDGITFDLLHEIETITGFTFNVVNDEHTDMYDLIRMLSGGEAHMFSDLIYSNDRAPFFIWSNHKLASDQYALLSKINFPHVSINEIPYMRIGLVKNTAHAELFRKWFPTANNIIEFSIADEAFYAMEHNKIDMVMAGKTKLLYYSNYYEFSGYKANFIFNYFYESAFAFNKDQLVLRSVVDKALSVINKEVIVEQWLTKTYDYRVKIAEARLPWLIGAILMTLFVLFLILILFLRNRRNVIWLMKENERTRVMLDTLPIACFIGGNHKVFDCNNEAVRLFELDSKSEFIKYFHNELSPAFQPDGQKSYDAKLKHGAEVIEKGQCEFSWMHQLINGTPIPSIVTLKRVTYGKEDVIMAYVRDMREHTKMSGEIEKQNILLNAVSKVSSILLEPDTGHFNDTLRNVLGTLAKIVSVDRICIYISSNVNNSKDHDLTFTLNYVMEDNEFKTLANNGVLSDDIIINKNHPWHAVFSAGSCINSFVKDMSPIEQEKLIPLKVKSIFVVPIFLHDNYWGLVGFDHCKKEEVFSNSDAMILRSASRMIANAVIRNDMAGELIFAKEQAEQSNRSKSIFLSQMSHEIRTPMNAILGIAEIQLRNAVLSPDIEEAFGKIYEAGDLLLNIINDILDLSKIESGKLEVVPFKYDIPSLINDTAQLNRMRYDSKAIELLIHLEEDTPVDLFGDELRIKQVLNNILSNAFKYTEEGTIEFAVSAEYSPDNIEDVMLIFRISDTGQGMTEDQLEKLYDEYTRFNIEYNRTVVGVGLGMSITKRLVGLLNGKISVQSEIGKGTVFTVHIPQKRTSTEVCGPDLAEKLRYSRFQSTAILKKTQFMREYMPYASVLIVDDVESNIYVIKGMLLPYGIKIDTAYSGFEAIEKIRSGNAYDIIFMDHMMPKMDGIEAVKIIRDTGYTGTIVALTANAVLGRAEMFLENGFDGFISKPIDSRELNLILNEKIRNKKPPNVIEAARREKHQFNNSYVSEQVKKPIEKGLITGVIHDIDNSLNVLEELLPGLNSDAADMGLYTTTVHGIKSALANIHEMALSNAALKLEQTSDNTEKSVLLEETKNFMSMLRTLMEKLKSIHSDETDKAPAEVSPDEMDFLRSRLNEIKTACGKMDIINAKNILNELKQKKLPQNINSCIEEISLYLIRGEYSNIITIIDKVLA